LERQKNEELLLQIEQKDAKCEKTTKTVQYLFVTLKQLQAEKQQQEQIERERQAQLEPQGQDGFLHELMLI